MLRDSLTNFVRKTLNLPVRNGTSENQAVVYTTSVTFNILVRYIPGCLNNMSKHIKVPKVTPKSVSNVTSSGVFVTLNPISLKRFVFLYLKKA